MAESVIFPAPSLTSPPAPVIIEEISRVLPEGISIVKAPAEVTIAEVSKVEVASNLTVELALLVNVSATIEELLSVITVLLSKTAV